jgi:pimeloyl-ACP methyl ester carboxylesterase
VVLVHGGWHGGSCWRDVVPFLRAAGLGVHAPTLTGLGERAHLLTRDTDLELHVRDVAQVLVHEDLRDVLLVGHSYGGMVVAGVADALPDRVGHVVYLDAFVPADGQSLLGLLRRERRDLFLAAAREHGDGWLVPAPTPEALGVTDGETARWLQARLRPQPLRTFEQPLRLQHPPGERTPCSFVHCTEGPTVPSFAPFAQIARDAGWPVHTLATGHDAMLTAPGEVAALLLA